MGTFAVKSDAIEVLKRYGVDGEGFLTFPVDPVVIARKMGATVVKATLPDKDRDVVSLIVSKDGARKIILNEKFNRDTLRLACAHEVGNLLLARRSEEDFGALNYGHRYNAEHQFALELLMPASTVYRLWAENKTVKKLAKYFDVSYLTAETRVASLGLY